MKKHLLPTLSCLLFFLIACKPEKRQESPTATIAQTYQHVIHISDSLIQLVTTARDTNTYKEIRGVYRVLANNFLHRQDTAASMIMKLELANYVALAGEYDTTVACIREILPFFEAHQEYKKPLIRCYSLLGQNLHNTGGSIFLANHYCTKAAAMLLLPGADTFFNTVTKSQILYTASATNAACQLYEQALHFAQAAYRLSHEEASNIADPYQRLRPIVEISQIYIQRNQPDSARKYLDEAYGIITDPPGTPLRMKIDNLNASFLQNIKDYKGVLRYLSIPGADISDTLFYVYMNLNAHTMLGNKKEAGYFFSQAQQLLKRYPEADYTEKGYAFYRALYQVRFGERAEAIRTIEFYDSLANIIYDKERMGMTTAIESQYNLADKQSNIDRLNKANRSAETELQQKNTLLLLAVLIVAIISILIVILLLFLRQRRLQTTKQQLQAERDKIFLEQRLLRTQMEPHFIFNTLAALQSQVYNHDYEKAGVYLDHFSRLLRTSLENSRQNFVPLQEEADAINAYLALQQMRFGHAFDYTIHLYKNYEEDELFIPPMLLQPFVENAILHGMNDHEKLHIHIDIRKKEQLLYCTITDNGKGIQDTAANPGKKSLSIQITLERLAILSRESGKEASLSVRNNPNGTGTQVSLVFPYYDAD